MNIADDAKLEKKTGQPHWLIKICLQGRLQSTFSFSLSMGTKNVVSQLTSESGFYRICSNLRLKKGVVDVDDDVGIIIIDVVVAAAGVVFVVVIIAVVVVIVIVAAAVLSLWL